MKSEILPASNGDDGFRTRWHDDVFVIDWGDSQNDMDRAIAQVQEHHTKHKNLTKEFIAGATFGHDDPPWFFIGGIGELALSSFGGHFGLGWDIAGGISLGLSVVTRTWEGAESVRDEVKSHQRKIDHKTKQLAANAPLERAADFNKALSLASIDYSITLPADSYQSTFLANNKIYVPTPTVLGTLSGEGFKVKSPKRFTRNQDTKVTFNPAQIVSRVVSEPNSNKDQTITDTFQNISSLAYVQRQVEQTKQSLGAARQMEAELPASRVEETKQSLDCATQSLFTNTMELGASWIESQRQQLVSRLTQALGQTAVPGEISAYRAQQDIKAEVINNLLSDLCATDVFATSDIFKDLTRRTNVVLGNPAVATGQA